MKKEQKTLNVIVESEDILTKEMGLIMGGMSLPIKDIDVCIPKGQVINCNPTGNVHLSKLCVI